MQRVQNPLNFFGKCHENNYDRKIIIQRVY